MLYVRIKQSKIIIIKKKLQKSKNIIYKKVYRDD